MRGFLIKVEFQWGFQARVAGMSKTASSFLFPPPTTLLGAIAEPYSVRKGFSEGRAVKTMGELSRGILSLSYKSLNAFPTSFQDINRIIAIRTSGRISYPSPIDPNGSFDAPARGKTSLSTLDGMPPTFSIALVISEALDLRVEDLWKIKRIGSRESLVAVTEVKEIKPTIVGDEVLTTYSFPCDEGVEILEYSGQYVDQFFVPVRGLEDSPANLYLNSKAKKFRVGLPLTEFTQFKAKLKLSKGYVGYGLDQEQVVGVAAQG